MFNIEHVIKPVVNTFNDYKGKLCLSIILGYGYRYNCIEDARLDEIAELNKVFILNIVPLLQKEYGINPMYCFGDCLNSSYVEHERKESFGSTSLTLNLAVGGDIVDNDYYAWRLLNYTTGKVDDLDTSIIYSLFPKENITLSKKENLNVSLDTFKLLK